jgi:hypothetical protein
MSQIYERKDIVWNIEEVLLLLLTTSTTSIPLSLSLSLDLCCCCDRRRMLSTLWKKWKSYRKILRAKAIAVTRQILSFGRSMRAFRAWQISFERKRRKEASQISAVRYQQNQMLLGRCLRRWKEYNQEQEFEKEIEERVDVTWAKVQNWLI